MLGFPSINTLHVKQAVVAVLTDKLGTVNMILGNHKPPMLAVLQTHILYHKQWPTHTLSMSTSELDTSPPLFTSVCPCSVSYTSIYHCGISSINSIPLLLWIEHIHFIFSIIVYPCSISYAPFHHSHASFNDSTLILMASVDQGDLIWS